LGHFEVLLDLLELVSAPKFSQIEVQWLYCFEIYELFFVKLYPGLAFNLRVVVSHEEALKVVEIKVLLLNQIEYLSLLILVQVAQLNNLVIVLILALKELHRAVL